jgi:hypothetical protein
MKIVEERLRGDLPTKAGEVFGFPAELDKLPIQKLLGMFHVFRNGQLGQVLDAGLSLENATSSLRREAALVTTVSKIISQWPHRWHETLAQINAIHFEQADIGEDGLVTHDEALAPFLALERIGWSAASEYPGLLRAELRAHLRKRCVDVGSYRLYASGARRSEAASQSMPSLCHLRTLRGGRHDLWSSNFSTAAASKMLDASPHQMDVLRSVGVLPARRSNWISASALDAAFEELAAGVQRRRRTVRDDMVPLKDFSREAGDALAKHVGDVRSGRTPCFTWAQLTPPGLGNLFIPAACADRYLDARTRDSPLA